MKNKKLLSIVFAVCIIFSCLSLSVYAGNDVISDEKVCVEACTVRNYIVDGEIMYNGIYSIIGRQFDVYVCIKGLESISEFVFEIDYNKETLSLDKHYLNYNSDNINYMPMKELIESDDESVKLRLYDKKGLASPQYFSYAFRFRAEAKGKLDFNIRVLSLVDGDGNTYEPEIKIVLPEETHYLEEYPDPLPDFDISLSYGIYNFRTELAYPMTVRDFVSKLKDAENCDVLITTADGKVLPNDAYIPSGAKMNITFDSMPLFSTTFILIGDVNGDALINSSDARIVLRYSAKLERNTDYMVFSAAANVSSDTNKINAADARELLRFSAGIGQTYADWYNYHCVLEKYNTTLLNDNLR